MPGVVRRFHSGTTALDLDSESGRAFLQERVGFFNKVAFLISGVFFVAGGIMASFFAAHVEGDRAAVQAFSVRDGKVVAREGFLLDRLTEPEAVLASTLQQFYAGGRYVPREVLLPADVPDRELLESWLSQRRSRATCSAVP